MAQPPLTPLEALRRVDRVISLARADRMIVLIGAAVGLAIGLVQRNAEVAAFSLLALGVSEMDARGIRRLQLGDAEGLRWLIGAQAGMFVVVLIYAAWRWLHFDPAYFWGKLPELVQADMVRQMSDAGLDPEADRNQLLQVMNGIVCATLVFVSLLYQGGLALWFSSQASAVGIALENPSTPPPLGP